jgi:hypothetical protein
METFSGSDLNQESFFRNPGESKSSKNYPNPFQANPGKMYIRQSKRVENKGVIILIK